MNFFIEKNILENMLTSLQAFLEKKDNAEVTSHILFSVKNNSLLLNASDLEIFLEIKSDSINTKEEGVATCNGKKILDIIRILKDGEVNIFRNGSNLHIQQNKSKYKLPSFNGDNFPKMPSSQDLPKININNTKLIDGLKKINPSIATNKTKPELGGALIDIRNSVINIVSTDTKRLAIFKIDNVSDKIFSIIIPKKAISEIQKLFSSNIEIFYDKTNFIIKNDQYTFCTKIINGKFPDYERIIPSEFIYKFNLTKTNIIEAIKQVNILYPDIKITFNKDGLIFESLSKDNTEAKTSIETPIDLDNPLEIIVNSRHLIDFLSNIDTEDFIININDPSNPFQLVSNNFLSIIMPITN